MKAATAYRVTWHGWFGERSTTLPTLKQAENLAKAWDAVGYKDVTIEPVFAIDKTTVREGVKH